MVCRKQVFDLKIPLFPLAELLTFRSDDEQTEQSQRLPAQSPMMGLSDNVKKEPEIQVHANSNAEESKLNNEKPLEKENRAEENKSGKSTEGSGCFDTDQKENIEEMEKEKNRTKQEEPLEKTPKETLKNNEKEDQSKVVTERIIGDVKPPIEIFFCH